MAYTVLARKYRSQTFDEVVGQDAVTTTLKNAITSGRVHHGYLFCGTRGVGKTSAARILAKSLNCLSSDGPTLKPCGKCDSCRGIAGGEDIDVIEIDAASNTGVDNIRELRSNAIFRPARARFKIYIIDEVHMLSTGAFNALLKTLEEPPGHVKFIFATTDPQKVPATIQSRCQRFDFRPIPPEQIAERLADICKHEEIKADPAAIKRVARLANGSLRDGVSLLDQIIAVSGAKLTAEAVDEFLPAPHDELLAQLTDKLADADSAAAIETADRSLAGGHALDQWCTSLINQLRDLMVLRACGAETDLVDVPSTLRPRLVEQSQRFEPAAYVFMISVLEELRRAVRYSGSGRALIEAALVRMADASKFASIESLLAKLDGQPADSGPAPAARPVPTVARSMAPIAAPPPTAAPPAKKKEPLVNEAPATMSRPMPAASPPIGRPSAQGPSPAAASLGRPRSDDLKAAASEPMIRQALELFEGQLVNVKRVAGAAEEPA